MRSFILAFMLCVLCAVPPAVAQGGNYDVAKARWGMTMDEVRAEDSVEWDPIHFTAGLSYDAFLLNTKVKVLYRFVTSDSGLDTVMYFFDKKANGTELYNLLGPHLAAKYKEVPVEKIQKNFKGKARQFENSRTGIVLALPSKEDDMSTSCTLRYFDNTHGKAWEEEQARRAKDVPRKKKEAEREKKAAQEKLKRELQQF